MTRKTKALDKTAEEKRRRRNAREKARRADPEYRAQLYAKQNKRRRRYRAENSDYREKEREYARKQNQRPDYKQSKAAAMQKKYHANPEHAAKLKKYQSERRAQKRLNDEYDHFMSRLAEQEAMT